MSLWTTLVVGFIGLVLGVLIRLAFDFVRRRFRRSGRLLGIRVLALYELFVGIAFTLLTIGAAYSVVTRYEELRAKLVAVNSSPEQLLADLVVTSVSALFVGIGLWWETRWSWNAAVFVLAFAVTRDVVSMLVFSQVAEQLRTTAALHFSQHSLRALISLIGLVYLFRRNVMIYCNVDRNRAKHIKNVAGGIFAGFILQRFMK